MVARSLLFLIAIFVLTGSIVSAETKSTDSAKPKKNREQIELREERKDLMVQKSTIIREQNQELKNLVQARRASLSAEIKANRVEFRTKLQEIKDERKQLLAENIDEKLNTINQDSTNRMSLALGKMSTLLDKFSSRAAALEEGENVASVESAITAAETAISDAEDAVASQAAKDYTPEITDETTLRSNFGETMSQLRKDLKATYDIVKSAKQKVIDVARTLAKLKLGDIVPSNEPTASPSGSQVVSPTIEPTI
jgi:Spy/CpxP family protein refolding chaperone